MAHNHFLRWVERHGQRLRQKCGLSPMDVLDPFELDQVMDITVMDPNEIKGLSREERRVLEEIDWDGGALKLPDGRYVVVLNTARSHHRQKSTLMEELAHIYLDHRPT